MISNVWNANILTESAKVYRLHLMPVCFVSYHHKLPTVSESLNGMGGNRYVLFNLVGVFPRWVFFATGPRRIVFAKRTTALKVARQRRSRQLKPNTQPRYLRLVRWMNVEFWWSQIGFWSSVFFVAYLVGPIGFYGKKQGFLFSDRDQLAPPEPGRLSGERTKEWIYLFEGEVG